MKIFITGSTGFLGRDLTAKLAGEHIVTCLVRKNSRYVLTNEKIMKFVGDLKNKQDVEDSLKDADLVLHLATSDNPKEDIIFMENLVTVSKKKGLKKIIFFSSMAATRKIRDDYGNSKSECERILKESGINYTILRPSFVYSHDRTPSFAKPLRLVPFFIPIIGGGFYRFNPIYREDITIFTEKILQDEKSDGKIYELGGDESFSFNELIKLMKKEKNIKKLVIHVPIFLSLRINKIFKFTSNETIQGINESSKIDLKLAREEFNFRGDSIREHIRKMKI